MNGQNSIERFRTWISKRQLCQLLIKLKCDYLVRSLALSFIHSPVNCEMFTTKQIDGRSQYIWWYMESIITRLHEHWPFKCLCALRTVLTAHCSVDSHSHSALACTNESKMCRSIVLYKRRFVYLSSHSRYKWERITMVKKHEFSQFIWILVSSQLQ